MSLTLTRKRHTDDTDCEINRHVCSGTISSAAVVRLCDKYWLVAIIDRWFMRQVKRHTYTQAWLVDRRIAFSMLSWHAKWHSEIIHPDLHTITRVVSQ